MNGDDPKLAALDARMRRMLKDLDAEAGFETRVMHRVAAQRARYGAVRADLREQFERRRELVRRRLRQEAWSYAITIAGIGAASGALVWRHAAQIGRWVAAIDSPVALDPMLLAGVTLAAIGAGSWPLLRKMPRLMP